MVYRIVVVVCTLLFCVANGQPPPPKQAPPAPGPLPPPPLHETDDPKDPQADFLQHRCPPHEVWLGCGPSCGDRWCPNPRRPLFRCNSNGCGRRGCYCERGYVRDEHWNCIWERSCPPLCQENEEIDRCGTECERGCPRSLHEASNPPFCRPSVCGPPACVCKRGYYRYNGVCVRVEQCPNVCAPNEIKDNCGRRCEETCDDFISGQGKVCPAICDAPACRCNKGFYRDSFGRCVRAVVCLKCGQHERDDVCAPSIECQEHCDWHRGGGGDRFGRCSPRNQPCRRGCVCEERYVRNREGVCIPRDRCDRRPPWGHGGHGAHNN